MLSSEKLFEKSLKLVPGGVHSPVRSFKGLHTTPRFMESAKGAFITDVDGKEYIDFCMSFGPLILGHQDEDVKAAIIEALNKGWSYGACERYSLEMAEFLISKIKHIDQIRFMNSGTEAVMTALRLARGFTGRDKIIKFNGCYHGHMDSMLIKSGSGLAGTSEASSLGITKEIAQNTLVVDLNDMQALETCFKVHGKNVAAIAIEPLPANYGLLIQDFSFLKKIRSLCDQYGVLLIFDEVISGLRVGFGGMSELTGVTPDLVTYGKIIGGGMPVGAVGGRLDIMQKLAPAGEVYQAGTLSANPAAMRAGLVSLQKISRPGFYETLEKNTLEIKNIFLEWFAGYENGKFSHYTMTSFSSLIWAHPKTKNPLTAISQLPADLSSSFYELFKVLLDKGIYFAPNAYEVGFLSSAHDKPVATELKRRLWQ